MYISGAGPKLLRCKVVRKPPAYHHQSFRPDENLYKYIHISGAEPKLQGLIKVVEKNLE